MASIETRPYRTARASTVSWEVSIASPKLDKKDLHEIWQVGQDLLFNIAVVVRDSFWADTHTDADTPLTVVAIATCAVARKKWQVRRTLDFNVSNREIALSLLVPGAEIAQEVSLDLWVVGDAPVGQGQIHRGAKLWESANRLVYPLEGGAQAFPTSAISFRQTNRPAVPWLVEVVGDATPDWKVSASLRLYVNTDFPVTQDILDDVAPAEVYTQISHDIYFRVLQNIARWDGPGGYSVDELDSMAQDDFESLAALGRTAAHKIALSFGSALAMARDDSYALMTRIREAFPYYQRSL